ncbi:MAG: hydroxymethylbilane synthase [Dehalococcoidia bacterium]|nr:hydroxymethylbilane synthase [Dehalococcoidia bacterium]
MSRRALVIGTRGSRLALRQTEIVLAALRSAHPGAAFEVRTLHTEGDRSAASLSEIGGRGVFVVELERALLAGEIDIAVHSLKDLPSEETDGLAIAATLPREDVRDVLITRDGSPLSGLPAGAAVGTGSPRRACQVLALRPDLRIRDIRGNVDTRIRKVQEGGYDAVVLAAAGLARLGWLDRASQVFTLAEMLPAAGQGALAVQVRSDDERALPAVKTLDHADTHIAVTAERAFERRLGGGCHAAIAALGLPSPPPAAGDPSPAARARGEEAATLRLLGLVGAPDGRLLRAEIEGAAEEAESLGSRLAERLLAEGAAALLASAPSGEAAS